VKGGSQKAGDFDPLKGCMKKIKVGKNKGRSCKRKITFP